MSFSCIDRQNSSFSVSSPDKGTKSSQDSKELEQRIPTLEKSAQDQSQKPEVFFPIQPRYIFQEVSLNISDKKRILLKLKDQYTRKHPQFNIQKYMSTEVSNDQENLVGSILHPDYDDSELIQRLRRNRALKRSRKNSYAEVPGKIDTNLKIQTLRECSPLPTPLPTKTPHRTPSTRPLEHNDSQGQVFMTEQMEGMYDTIDSKQGNTFVTENNSHVYLGEISGTARENKASLPHESRRGSPVHLRWEQQSFHNVSRYSCKSFDMASEISKASNHKAKDEYYIPKEYSVDKASKFKYLYQQFKNPKLRGKSGPKRLGSMNDSLRNTGGFNKITLEPITRSRKITLSKIDENKYENRLEGSVHSTKSDLLQLVGDLSGKGMKFDSSTGNTNVLSDINNMMGRGREKQKLFKVDLDGIINQKEAYKRARREHGRSKTKEIQDKSMDQSLQNLKNLFEDYANIKINDTLKVPPVIK